MKDPRCEVMDLPRSSCAHCTGRNGDPADMALLAERNPGPWIEAQYRGNCSECRGRIQPGAQIRPDGQGGWLCASCGA
jgi:hypothetical protein